LVDSRRGNGGERQDEGMRDRTFVIAFFGIIVAIGLFTSGSALGAAIGLITLILVGIVLALEPRTKETKETDESESEETRSE
jgi:hypothetical protein